MLKKAFIRVIVITFVSTVLLVGMNFDAAKAVNYDALGTTVGGYISENTTWTLERSPYIVFSDIIVEKGVVLTIEAGVLVKFNNGTNLVVDGTLLVKGTKELPIIFTSSSTSPKPGDWGRIYLRGKTTDPKNEITYATIQYATFGLFSEYRSFELYNSNVTNCCNNGISVINSDDQQASIIIVGCIISENNGSGIGLFGGGFNITGNIIAYNGNYGIDLDVAGPGVIADNKITFNQRSGVHISNCMIYRGRLEVINNIAMGNDVGIQTEFILTDPFLAPLIVGNIIQNNSIGILIGGGFFRGGSAIITRNDIIENNVGVLSDYDSAYVEIRGNKIYENAEYDLVHKSKADINATYNWWGTTNETLIAHRIYDYYDDWNYGKVLFKPYIIPPKADFTIQTANSYVHVPITFDASASVASYGSITSYTWNFGDGNVTTITSPIIQHVYTIPRTYNVTLIILDELGLTNSTFKTLFVLQDNVVPFSFDDYDGLWHNVDFLIKLTAVDYESGVAETYYRINNGPVKAVSTDGHPLITTEGANNTLEYWSVDKAGNEENPHKLLTGIKLDKTSPEIGTLLRIPEGDVKPNQTAKILVNVTDSLSGIKNVTLLYSLNISTIWIDLPMTFNSAIRLYEAAIQVQHANVLVEYKIIAYDNAGNIKVEDNNGQYYTYTVIPEFPSTPILALLMLTALTVITLLKVKRIS
jgi:PKD repeat protein